MDRMNGGQRDSSQEGNLIAFFSPLVRLTVPAWPSISAFLGQWPLELSGVDLYLVL